MDEASKIFVRPDAKVRTLRKSVSASSKASRDESDERTEPFSAGDGFADSDLHGFRNASDVPFVYFSVTTSPVNFREAYAKEWSSG